MAQQGVQLDRRTFSCSICLDLLKDPVALHCGHNYCMDCIISHWDGEDHRHIYSCPQCKKTFFTRPMLLKNTMLADLVEQLKKTELRAAPAQQCYAGPGDVACDYCPGRKLRAVKSCLVCLSSYCQEHLQPHYNVAPLKKHKLVEPSEKLQENLCSRHNEVMKIFCRTDKQLICYLCSMDEHKGHDTVTAAAERAEKQQELVVSRQNIQQRIQDREKNVALLRMEVEAIDGSADRAVQHSEKTFSELISLLRKRSSEVEQQLKSKQETEVRRVRELQEKLGEEITKLRRRDVELNKLSHTEDHNQFLQSYSTFSHPSGSTESPSMDIRPLRYFEDVTAAVSAASDKLQDVLTQAWTDISLIEETQVDVLLPRAEPRTRTGLLRYSRDITLDPNTANAWLLLSKGNRKAAVMREDQSYSKHPDRFFFHGQVLSSESLTGRCYWEVKWRGKGVNIVVAYKSISRVGPSKECSFGLNDQSWAFCCFGNNLQFYYNGVCTPISGPLCNRVGVYLDHSAGILSFYSISETMEPTLLHRVKTRFTQPLYAGIYLKELRDTAEFCKLK